MLTVAKPKTKLIRLPLPAKDLALLDGVGDFNQHNANSMQMFGMPSSSNSHLHCDNSGHVRAGVVDAYDIQDPYSLVPELPALEHEPSNSSLSQVKSFKIYICHFYYSYPSCSIYNNSMRN